eukprot:TRINITY_DN6826_c0_g3_i1.p1 TRINITY_DN6826_c0_g3~~TRINITY_DN6826_c0_g3_i1.p1  ORF type:complete len:649 (+),score=169.64 TRINITY_DN6826_c0_g3_i1:153-2099(+)
MSGRDRRAGDRRRRGSSRDGSEARTRSAPRRERSAKRSRSRSRRKVQDPPRLRASGCSTPSIAGVIDGRFASHSTNHGRPVYKKEEKAKGMDVLIYYWDDRDDADMCGWWFGPKVGGDQVWAHHPSESSTPPEAKWHVPHDKPVDPSFTVKVGSGSSAAGRSQRHSRDKNGGEHREAKADGESRSRRERSRSRRERSRSHRSRSERRKASNNKKASRDEDSARHKDEKAPKKDKSAKEQLQKKGRDDDSRQADDVVKHQKKKRDTDEEDRKQEQDEDTKRKRKQEEETKRKREQEDEAKRKQQHEEDLKRKREEEEVKNKEKARKLEEQRIREEEEEELRQLRKRREERLREEEELKRRKEQQQHEEEELKKRREALMEQEAEEAKKQAERTRLEADEADIRRQQAAATEAEELRKLRELAEEARRIAGLDEPKPAVLQPLALESRDDAAPEEAGALNAVVFKALAPREQQAVLKVLCVLARLAGALPEDYDRLKALYDIVVPPELPLAGRLEAFLREEADRVLRHSSSYVEALKRQRTVPMVDSLSLAASGDVQVGSLTLATADTGLAARLDPHVELIQRYDSDRDGQLSREDILAYARGELHFELPLPALDRIWRTLRPPGSEGLPLAAAQRLKIAIGLAREQAVG